MTRFISLCVLLMLISGYAISQTRAITGNVIDTEGNPVPFATVIVKGASTGVAADKDGNFSISVGTNSILTVSSTGFISQEVNTANQNSVTITLHPLSNLEEVVVVGYGTQQRKDITGAVASISTDNIVDMPTPSIDKSFQGQVAGLQASNPSGILGQPARIRIRGTNSISSSSSPLYVVDGVPYISGDQGGFTPYNPISDLNPTDIASIEVLKDGAATAIYGSNASNGVILITTKSGKVGKPSVSYNAWVGISQASKRFDLLNADQFVEIANEKYTNYGVAGPAHPSTTGATDWQDIALRNAFQQSHSLSLSGATDQTNYLMSVIYEKMDGITVGNDLEKYGFRGKIDQKAFNNRLSLGGSMAVTYNRNNGLNTGNNALSGNIGGAIRLPPNVSPKNPDGTWNITSGNKLGAGPNDITVDDNYTNLEYVLEHNIYNTQALNLNGLAYAKLKIVDGLNFTTQIGINYLNVEDYLYYNPIHGDGNSSNGIVDQAFSPTFRYNVQNLLNYTKKFGDHSLDVLLGQEAQRTRARTVEASGTDISDVFFGVNRNLISNTLANQFADGGASEKAHMSFFGRVNYSYLDKYLVSASLRRDKLSALPWGHQDATLPGGSIGWRFSKENFFSNGSLSNVINDAKIRASYAKVGNVEIGNYPYAGTFGARQYGDWSGVQFTNMGNSNLRFETSKQFDIGLDMSFSQNRIQLTLDYFNNNIDNLILAVPTPPSLGVPLNQYSANVGKMNNKGFEISVNSTNIRHADFRWTTAFNISFVKNKVLALVDNKDIINTYNITTVGSPIGSFYGYKSVGVNTENGNPIFEKADGSFVQFDGSDDPNYGYFVYDPHNPADESTETTLSAGDKRILGQANPKWYGGLTNTFYYKSFDFNIVFTFAGGNQLYNITRQESLLNQKFQNNGTEILKRWTTPGQVTDVPKLWYGEDNTINQNNNLNSRFLEKADYLRAQNISLGYSYPVSSGYIKSIRFYVQIQNAFIITGYTGLDPELSMSVTTNQTPGLDWNVNPVPRTYSFGVNLNF